MYHRAEHINGCDPLPQLGPHTGTPKGRRHHRHGQGGSHTPGAPGKSNTPLQEPTGSRPRPKGSPQLSPAQPRQGVACANPPRALTSPFRCPAPPLWRPLATARCWVLTGVRLLLYCGWRWRCGGGCCRCGCRAWRCCGVAPA